MAWWHRDFFVPKSSGTGVKPHFSVLVHADGGIIQKFKSICPLVHTGGIFNEGQGKTRWTEGTEAQSN
jgi:hypothetical protein